MRNKHFKMDKMAIYINFVASYFNQVGGVESIK